MARWIKNRSYFRSTPASDH